MCDRPDCHLCRSLNQATRDPDWCMVCLMREVGEGLTTCVMCAVAKPNP